MGASGPGICSLSAAMFERIDAEVRESKSSASSNFIVKPDLGVLGPRHPFYRFIDRLQRPHVQVHLRIQDCGYFAEQSIIIYTAQIYESGNIPYNCTRSNHAIIET